MFHFLFIRISPSHSAREGRKEGNLEKGTEWFLLLDTRETWACCLTSLNLSFLTCDMAITILILPN